MVYATQLVLLTWFGTTASYAIPITAVAAAGITVFDGVLFSHMTAAGTTNFAVRLALRVWIMLCLRCLRLLMYVSTACPCSLTCSRQSTSCGSSPRMHAAHSFDRSYAHLIRRQILQPPIGARPQHLDVARWIAVFVYVQIPLLSRTPSDMSYIVVEETSFDKPLSSRTPSVRFFVE